MLFLIDGYNLLHAVGWMSSRRLSEGRLRAARTRLLDWLADRPGVIPAGHRFRVIFDALHGPADRTHELSHRGVAVLFAHRQTADDCIEELLEQDRFPDRLTVVSNDLRLQVAANRIGSRGWSCQQFLDWLIERERQVRETGEIGPPEKPEGPPPPAEAAKLLEVFDIPQPRRTSRLK